ncbi:hypothetical protein ElyMa_004434100 [Elysia marginata]|uniref:Uncharacterized protein n=1 Tax=Elysia marginata TaxID=1093978 RepID=A0AAV4HDW1_9GAST|nr:hypothetical protein ElyMa_004434100 [Elysia marginata]
MQTRSFTACSQPTLVSFISVRHPFIILTHRLASTSLGAAPSRVCPDLVSGPPSLISLVVRRRESRAKPNRG